MPSLTELVFSLGLGEHLVARTGFCVHPKLQVGAVPKVGGTKDVNVDKLHRLAPTHVLANVDENRRETVDALRGFVPQVLVTHPCAPVDNLGLLDQMEAAFGTVPGVAERAGALRREVEGELASSASCLWPDRRVLYLIWREPWMTVARDTYIARMLATVGWQTWPTQEGGPTGAARYPVVHGDEPWLDDMELVLLSSEPYRFDERHVAEAASLCPHARVQCVDGELISWYGPRAVSGLRYLRTLAGRLAASSTMA